MATALTAPQRLARDPLFAAALLAAPAAWAGLLLADLLTPATGWPTPARVLQLVLIYPVLEELVFRGALQGWLRTHHWALRSWHSLTVANLLTSAVFTLVHLLVNPGPVVLLVFIPSLVFGYFRDRYDRLHACILLHMFYNLLAPVVTL